MAQGFSAALVGVLDATLNPPGKLDGRIVGARLRVHEAVLDLAAATVKTASGDTNVIVRIPRSHKPIAFLLNSTVDLGAAATIAIGIAGTAAKYMAAATFRTPNAPTLVMVAAAADDVPLADHEDVLLTIAVAALPGAGILTIHALVIGR